MSFDLTKTTKTVGRWMDNNSPALLSAVAIVGVVSTVAMAIKATPKAMLVLETEERFRREEGNLPEINTLDKMELTWKIYLPSAVMGLITIGCIIGSNHISTRRNAALISLIGVAENVLREYQEKVVETIGENKEEKIHANIAQDQIDNHPVTESTIIMTGHGSYLCYDNFSKRYFRSEIEAIRRSANEFNRKLNIEGWLTINYLYDLLGLEPIELGDEYGWIAERALLDLKFNTRMAKDTDEPALVIDYMVKPYHI